jgi:hypothetical protein
MAKVATMVAMVVVAMVAVVVVAMAMVATMVAVVVVVMAMVATMVAMVVVKAPRGVGGALPGPWAEEAGVEAGHHHLGNGRRKRE